MQFGGNVIAPWQLSRPLDRIEISQEIFASGHLKAFLNPFTPLSKDAQIKAQYLVDHVGHTFCSNLNTAARGFSSSAVNYGGGEIWAVHGGEELG